MANLSNEQIDFFDKLSDWASSEECRLTIFNKLCSAIIDLIHKKEKSKESEKVEILKESLSKEIDDFSNESKYSMTSFVIEFINTAIKKSKEEEFYGLSLLKLANDINAAKEQLMASYIKSVVPSDLSLEMDIKERKIRQKLNALISKLNDWVTDLSVQETYSKEQIIAVRSKYKRYKEEFEKNQHYCSTCVLSKYIDKPDEAKEFLSELFTEEQETFYSKLESWTDALENTKCGDWLSSYLKKGRDLRIKDIDVLRYLGDEDKAKAFLLSKYEEKLERKRKKYNSIFDNYNEHKNSLSSFFSGLTETDKLYSKCLSTNSNDKIKPLSLMSYENGLTIKNDCISIGIVDYHLSLQVTNRLFYTYSSTFRKHTTTFSFFTPHALEIVKNYCSNFLDNDILNHAMGLVVVRDFERNNTVKCYCCLLTDEASQFDDKPLFAYNSLKANNSFYHDAAGFRLVFKAFIWHLLKNKTNTIDFSADRDFSNEERTLIFELIDDCYDIMSFEEKYICHFIDTDKYKFPEDSQQNNEFKQKSLTDRVTNLKNCICCQYNSQVLDDRYFQFAKIAYEYGDTNFSKLANTVGRAISNGMNLELWFDNSSTDFLSNLRVLTFLNWAYVSNETGNVKKITACWLISIIFMQYKESSDKDKNFWTLMLAYILIENESVFNSLLFKLKKEDTNHDNYIDVKSIVLALTNDLKTLKRSQSYKQKDFLSNNMHKCYFFEDYQHKNKKVKRCKLNEAEAIINNICDLIVAKHGTIKDYSKDVILELLNDVPKFEVPDNFTYTSHHNRNYDRYNGDYRGTYAHDEMGYSNSDIDTIFEGDPDAYWNID